MPGRKYQAGSSSYRYSINGQEKESELNENVTNALYWEYDSRIGRRWNIDQIEKVNESSYLCYSGNPILYRDPLGLDAEDPKPKTVTLETVVVKSKMTKAQKNRYAAVRNLMKKEHISWGEAFGDVDASGNIITVRGSTKKIIDHTKDGNSMEKDVRQISTEIKIKVLTGAAYAEGSAVILLTGGELWEPALEVVTEKSIELYVTSNMVLNSARKKALSALLELAVLKYGKDAIYRKELWKLSGEIKNYKELFTAKTIVEIIKRLDKIIKHYHY